MRVIAQTLVDIDCAQKTALLDDGSLLPYDTLVLTPGLQDQTIATVLAAANADEKAPADGLPLSTVLDVLPCLTLHCTLQRPRLQHRGRCSAPRR